jgi:2-amino-4-hydroxy-6-hydroxymethyldihydropteridine diphosphokinase
MMPSVFLLLGSNLGDKIKNLKNARDGIENRIGLILQKSSVYATQAWGIEDQPEFLNQALAVHTPLQPAELMDSILHLEKDLGRIRTQKWNERIIDIDILLYEDKIIDTPTLSIPHPQMVFRRFALTPLQEIAADYVHPRSGKTIGTLLQECADPLRVLRLETL